MMNSNDKKWTVAEVLTSFGQRQSQIQQEKMVKQQLKDALMQNQAQGLSQFIPGMQQEMPPMQQDMSLDQAYQEAKRGGIKLDPRKKGTFKAQATRMGMSIQEAASHILANRKQYSPAMVKKANFARNFAKEEGGEMMQYAPGGEMMACPEGQYWDGQRCVDMPKQISDRNMQTYYTNPPSYGVFDNAGNSLYDGQDQERAKGYYAKGAGYAIVPPEGISKTLPANPLDMLRQVSEKHSEVMRNIDLNRQQEIQKQGQENWNKLKTGIEKQRDGGMIKRKAEGGSTDCPEDFKWDETLQSCVPIVTENYAKDYLTDWYARRGEVINDPNFDELPKPKGHVDWLGKVLPMINERMATSPLTYAYPDIIDGDPALRGVYTRQTKTQGPVIEISSIARQNPFEHAQTDLHERTTDSTFTAEKYVEPQHQKIINENIKSYEDFRDASPIADQVKADEALDDELYGQYLYSTGQTPEGLGNMHSYVMNWRKTFNMDPTKVYSEEEIADMIKQAENAGMFTKGSPTFNDDMYKLFKLSKDNKSMTDLFNLMVKNTSPVKPNRLNDDIQYAKDGGSFGYMPNFF